MNILFYLTPKCDCAYLEEGDTLRQALEKMEARRYAAIPLLSKSGQYVGTITEGDLLWGIKNKFNLDLREAEKVRITSLDRKRDYMPLSIRANMEDLSELALYQNFVPVSDDDGNFIGIVTRQEIYKFLKKQAAAAQKNADEALKRAEAAEKKLLENA